MRLRTRARRVMTIRRWSLFVTIGLTGYRWRAWLFGVSWFPAALGPLVAIYLGPLVAEFHFVKNIRARELLAIEKRGNR
jgi:hypothetical protein